MGFWVNIDADTTFIHQEDCLFLIADVQFKGRWHYAKSWADVKLILNRRSHWKLCEVCFPMRDFQN